MKRIVPLLALAALVAGLAGCETLREREFERSLTRDREAALADIDVEDCRRRNGRIRQVGMFATPACIVPFADAGETCRADADCEGACVAPDGIAVGTATAGACQVDSAALFGCHDLVEGGVVVGGMCLD